VIGDPKNFDAWFRKAMNRPAAPARLDVSAYCGQHPDAAMLPLPGQEPPSNPLPANYRVRVACPICGTEIELGLQTSEEEPTS
jgi:hypothetical protein